MTLLLGQEVIHKPATLEQGPFYSLALVRAQKLSDGFPRAAVEAGTIREFLNVAAVLGRHEALTGAGGLASGEEGAVDGDVAFIVDVEERYQGGGVGGIEDFKNRVGTVVAFVHLNVP